MKRILQLMMILSISLMLQAQSIEDAFFTQVDYIGAFDGSDDWTEGWTEWDPVNVNYPATTETKGNGQFSRASGLHITTNETWNGILLLDGWVYVDEGATLTITEGTIIRGTAQSALVIERGGKIMAVGTSQNPIVFTSNQGAGFRSNSDWAGIVICGSAPNNLAGGEGVAEGGIESPYGGSNPNDNSGELKYVRIEFPGYEVATNKEINGLTLCSVGDGTQIDYIQVSNSGDDGFEWFGGTVNAKHLISYRTEDDDFDTDNGFSGLVQFGLIARDSSIVDTDAANAFESDNNEGGTNTTPKTNGVFSNITAIGPAVNADSPAILRPKFAEGSALRLRRNTRLQIYNSVFAGWGRGMRLESEGSFSSATTDDSLTVRNTIIAGTRGSYFVTDVTAGVTGVRDWFMQEELSNDTLVNASELLLAGPFNYDSRDFQPQGESPVLCASIWAADDCGAIVGLDNKDEYLQNNISVYPNPFENNTSIDIELNENANVAIVVLDLTGRVVYSADSRTLNSGYYSYPISFITETQGIYIAKVCINDTLKSIKLVAR